MLFNFFFHFFLDAQVSLQLSTDLVMYVLKSSVRALDFNRTVQDQVELAAKIAYTHHILPIF